MTAVEGIRSFLSGGDHGRKRLRDRGYVWYFLANTPLFGPKPDISHLQLVGQGNEHRVYLCDSLGVVFKVPKRRIVKKAATAEQVENNINLISRYFTTDQIAATGLLRDGQSRYLLVQEALPHPRTVKQHHLENPDTAHQVYDLLERNRRMTEETGFSLGILGQEGAIRSWLGMLPLIDKVSRPSLSNLLVTHGENSEEKVVIADLGLLDTIRSRRDRLSFAANQFLIGRHFGYTRRACVARM